MRLKNSILSLFLLMAISLNCQSKPLELSEGFAAFIVSDIEKSINWYTKNLGFELVSQTNFEKRGVKQANLRLGNTKIELIESRSSIDPTKNNTKKVLVQGIFKVGFIVSKFDKWKKHLIKQELITEKDIVKNPIDNKRMLIIKDPDGNRLQLFEN